jgi:hypothetical protein
MPFLINGVGTWYYGQRRMLRVKSLCEFCQALGELESYDTTLYITVLFVPLVPLGHKRILNKCPRCGKHRALALRKWEEAKAKDIAGLLEKLQTNPDDRELILAGLDVAQGYQDQILFDKLAGGLAVHRLEDAAIQARLGYAYGYFARPEEAEAAFRASLKAEDNPQIREQLARVLLKLNRPAEAGPYLQHILKEKLKDRVGFIHLLVEGYQAQGLHQEALETIEARDEAFPELTQDKYCKKQRQNALRYQHSGKKIKSAALAESGKAGYKEGGWAGRLPRYIGPLVIAGLLCWYVSAAIHMGRARQIYVVNGSDKPYSVLINGRERQLPALSPVMAEVPEGIVTVESVDANVVPEPLHIQIETSFWSRPFSHPTFIINPERLAILVHEENVYSAAPRGAAPPLGQEFLTGSTFYSLSDIDYAFVDFPPTIQIKQGKSVHKTRVALVPNLTAQLRLGLVAGLLRDQERLTEYAKRLLAINADDLVTLSFVLNQQKEEEQLRFLESGLASRPPRVEWHRVYQSLMEKHHPDVDLRPRYQKLLGETRQSPDALYLLARLDRDESEIADKLYRQAVQGSPPSAYAANALAYKAMAAGDFAEAIQWSEKAIGLVRGHVQFEMIHRQALLAAKKYDTLLQQLEFLKLRPEWRLHALQEQIMAYELKGDKSKVGTAINEARIATQGDAHFHESFEAGLTSMLCCCRNDVQGFLKVAPRLSDQARLQQALLRGEIKQAAGLVAVETEAAASQYGLLYLAALQNKDQELAQSQWGLLLAALKREDNPSRELATILEGKSPVDAGKLRRLAIEPGRKRVLLAVAAKRFPRTSKDLLPLARSLDFSPDATSLCLRKILD